MGRRVLLTYFELANGHYRVMRTDKPKEFFTYEQLPRSVNNKYHMFKGYDATDEGLKLFTKDFLKWCKELNKKSNKYRIDYTFYYNHWIATIEIFKKLSKDSNYNISDNKVDLTEANYIKSCYNAGLTFCNPGTYNCYGYDYNSFYPRCLASNMFQIPTNSGRECYTDLFKLLKSKTKLDYGYYHVQIRSTNPDTKKIFSFSADDMYTHYSVQFAWEHRKQHDFKFAFYKQDEFNSYLYYDKDLITGDVIFGTWLTTLTELRKLYPKNKLLKHLLSSIWGSITKANTFYLTYDEIKERKINVGMDYDCDYQILDKMGIDSYKLLDNYDPYKYGAGRIKSFLTSYGRVQCAKVALSDIDNVVRIHTDGVCFSSEQDITGFDNLSLEDKTTGHLTWEVVNRHPIRL